MDETGVNIQNIFNPSALSNTNRSSQADELVGLEDEIEKIKARLTRGTDALDVFSIQGLGGIGKTTIANKLYKDLRDRFFHSGAFCSVSQSYDETKLLLDLVYQVTKISYESENLTTYDLGEKLYRGLKGKRYLIVMDDVWDSRAWNEVGQYFPKENRKSRILFTSRNLLQVMPNSPPHPLRLLSEEESWKLLEKKVFHQGNCPPALSDAAQKIADSCGRLPLAIVVAAGILRKTKQEPDRWEQIADSLSVGTQSECSRVFEVSYMHLPEHLKPCFLYFAAFPEDSQISTRKLTQFWIAENLIQGVEDRCLEDLAEGYLKELIGRSLVMVSKTRSLGGSRACHLHDLIRDFCLEKAKQENFMQLIHKLSASSTSDIPKPRLCIYSEGEVQHLDRFLSNPSLCTLLWFRFGYWSSRRELLDLFSYISKWEHLKVLDLGNVFIDESFFSIRLPLLLRYLSVTGYIESIPPSIAVLSKLETLIVKGDEGIIDLPDTIWEMENLRHLRIEDRFSFKLPDHLFEESFQLKNLQTLCYPILSHGRDAEKILKAMPRLRKLKCSILQKMMSSPDFDSYPQLDFLTQLESLHVRYSGFLVHSAAEFNLPKSLKKLTLVHLPWNNISTLARLPHLEVLKILSGGFDDDWIMTDEKFPKLRVLKLCRLGFAKWVGDNNLFPRLERLELERCEQLESIPSCFIKSSGLQLIDVKWCNSSVTRSVRDIEEEQVNIGNDELKVLIFPED